MRAINLYCDLMAQAVLDGLQAELASTGADVGAQAEPPVETLPEEAVPPPAEPEAEARPEA